MKRPWSCLSTKTVYENKWIRVREDAVIQPNSTPGVYGVVETKAKAVTIVAFDASMRVCLINEYQYPLERFVWKLPMGGAGHEHLQPLAAAKQELLEETGLSADRWHCIGQIEPIAALCTEVADIYLAFGNLRQTRDPGRPDEPIQDVRFVSIPELFEMMRTGHMTNGQSLSAILMAAAHLRSELSIDL